jgi:hypothetical protein
VKIHRTSNFIDARLQIYLQRLRLARLRIRQQFLVDTFTFNLKVMDFSAGILDDERSFAGFRRRGHVEMIFSHRDVDFLTFLRPSDASCGSDCKEKRNECFHSAKESQPTLLARLISDALPFGRLWYTKPDDPDWLRNAQQPFTPCCDSRLQSGCNVIETHEHAVFASSIRTNPPWLLNKFS